MMCPNNLLLKKQPIDMSLNSTTAAPAPLRIMIFIHSLHAGGAERVAVDLANQWHIHGHDVMVVTQTDARGDVYELNQHVERVALNTAGLRGVVANLRRLYALRKTMQRYRPDIVLGMMTTASILSIVASTGLRCRVIATEHTHPPSQNLSPFWLKLRRRTYPHAARVVALTRDTASWVVNHVPGSNMAVIPNAVHWPLTNSEPQVTPPLRNGRCRLLAVGRLHTDKGFDILIDSFRDLAAVFPDWDLVILGEGPERDRLQGQIDVAGLAGRISMPGRVGNMQQWYQACDIYVLSSRVEGLSNSLLEAMACGMPSVAFDCETGPREIIRPDIDGLLVTPVEDPQALAAALSALMQDKQARKTLASRAVDVRDRFSMRRVLSLWYEVFNDIQHQDKKG